MPVFLISISPSTEAMLEMVITIVWSLTETILLNLMEM